MILVSIAQDKNMIYYFSPDIFFSLRNSTSIHPPPLLYWPFSLVSFVSMYLLFDFM